MTRGSNTGPQVAIALYPVFPSWQLCKQVSITVLAFSASLPSLEFCVYTWRPPSVEQEVSYIT